MKTRRFKNGCMAFLVLTSIAFISASKGKTDHSQSSTIKSIEEASREYDETWNLRAMEVGLRRSILKSEEGDSKLLHSNRKLPVLTHESRTQRRLPIDYHHMSNVEVMFIAAALFVILFFLSCCCCCNTNLCEELVCFWAIWEIFFV